MQEEVPLGLPLQVVQHKQPVHLPSLQKPLLISDRSFGSTGIGDVTPRTLLKIIFFPSVLKYFQLLKKIYGLNLSVDSCQRFKTKGSPTPQSARVARTCFSCFRTSFYNSIYRDRLIGVQILLSSSQAGTGRTVKQEKEEISHNHVPFF